MTATETGIEAVGEATLAELAESLHGEPVTPASKDYDEARSIWNGAHDRRPALVIRCAGVADVIRGVDFARSEGRFSKHFDRDGNPSETLLYAQQDRLENWRLLQELAGVI